MGRYTKIPQNTFQALQLDAGVLLRNFDIQAATSSADNPGFTDADLICATTGGVNPSCVPSFSDLGEDVDNCPVNMKELKKLDSWECKLATTSLGTSAELIKLSLGCADINAETSQILPRRDLAQTDFTDLWWVGDKANGGFVAVQILNALSTGGFSLQTTKNGKGQTSLEFTGHVSINAQNTMPMVFYSIDPEETVTYTVTFDTDGGSEIDPLTVESGATITRPADPTKEDSTFNGWYKDSAKTEAWDFVSDTVTEDITLYAKWTTT